VAPGPLARSRRSRVAIAAGGYILVERGVYEAAGGHAGVRSRMVEDVCLAEAVKRGGHLLVPMPAGPLARLRMYHGGREVWGGWSKNASFAAAGGAAKGLAGAGATVALALTPGAAVIHGAHGGDRLLAATGVAGLLATVALQRLASRSARTPARYAPTLPLGMLVLAGAAARGSVGRLVGRGPEWRGRRYPLAR
jgi:chlorobactene glucosyltransferase